MADPVSVTFGNNSKINLQASAGGLEISAQASASVLEAIAQDLPFAAPVTVADGKLHASGNRDLVFDGGAGAVTFSGDARGGASLAAFFDPSDLVGFLTSPSGSANHTQVGLPDAIAQRFVNSVEGPFSDDELVLALRWGYAIDGKVNGKMALSPAANASFGFDGQSSGLFAVCRRLPRKTGARTGIESLLNNWMLPRQVQAPGDLEPGTWLVAQVDGGLALSLSAQLGYDFSWIRDVELGQLSGDVGLKIELGVAATLGLDVSGRYALVISRESSAETLRLRLFKLAKRGWSFGFDLGAEVTGQTPQPDLDELVQAVLGIQSMQLLADLDRLTDPQASLGALLGEEAAEYLKTLLGQVTGLDVDTAIAEANQRLTEVLVRWNGLDHAAAAKIWAKLGDAPAIREIRELAAAIVAAPDTRELLGDKLRATGFLSSAAAEWIESFAPQGLLGLLDREATAQKRLQAAAAKTLAVLDDAEVESAITKLKDYLAQRFGLDRLVAALDEAIAATDPSKLDAWLTKKLEVFFEQTLDRTDPGLRSRLEQIRETIHSLRGKADSIWSKTLAALNGTYSAKLAYRYQSTTTRQALFDVVLDFAVDADAAKEALRNLLTGELGSLLTTIEPAVDLREGTLAFGLSRQSSIDLTLPAFKRELTNLTTAWGRVTAFEEGGRVLLYEATGTNRVGEDRALAGARRVSRLAIAASLPVAMRGAVRLHQPDALRLSYSLDEAVSALRADHFIQQYRPWVGAYLDEAFPTDTDSAASGAFEDWVRALDRASDGAADGILGNTLASLQVALPSEVGAAWMAGIESGGDAALRGMSRQVQSELRRLIPLIYFQDVRNYGDLLAEPILVYSQVPPMNAFTVGSNRALKPKKKGDVYWWDLNDKNNFEALVFSDTTRQRLETECVEISRILRQVPGKEGKAKAYGKPDDRVRAMFQNVAHREKLRLLLVGLFHMEAIVIHGIERAARRLGDFLRSAQSNPEVAVEALTRFSADLAEAFGRDLWTIYGKHALRPLGPLVFFRTAGAFSASLPKPDALLSVSVLKPAVSPFPPQGFPENDPPAAGDIAVRQVIGSF